MTNFRSRATSRSVDLIALARICLNERFDCDDFVIACAGTSADRVFRTIVSDGLEFNPRSKGVAALLDSPAGCRSRILPLDAQSEEHDLLIVTSSHDGSSGSHGLVVVHGWTDAGERFAIGLHKSGRSSAEYAKYLQDPQHAVSSAGDIVASLSGLARLVRDVSVFEQGFDALGFGMLFAEPSGKVLFWNETARTIFASAFGNGSFPEVSGARTCVGSAGSRFIASIIDEAGHRTDPIRRTSIETVWKRLPHQEDRIPFHTMWLSQQWPGQADVCLVAYPDKSQSLQADLVLKTLGLTESETRLAAQIIAGSSVKAASIELGLTEESARTYLKRVFSKLGISRQAELVTKVSQMCSPVRAHPPSSGRLRGAAPPAPRHTPGSGFGAGIKPPRFDR